MMAIAKGTAMSTLNDKVDERFGPDTFDWVRELQRRTRATRGKYDAGIKPVFGVYDGGLLFRLDLAERISFDLDEAFGLTGAGRRIDPQQFKKVVELFQIAVETAEAEIEQLEAEVSTELQTGVLPFIRIYPYRQLRRLADTYGKELTELRAALERAQREKQEAYVDKVIDIGQLVISVAVPELALLKEVTIAAGGLFADSQLGPGDPSPSKAARTTLSTFKTPLLQMAELSKQLGNFAGRASKLNSIYDAADLSEIAQANDNIESLRKKLIATRTIYAEIRDTIWRTWEARMTFVIISLRNQEQQLRALRDNVREHLDALDEMRQSAGYRPPTVWRWTA